MKYVRLKIIFILGLFSTFFLSLKAAEQWDEMFEIPANDPYVAESLDLVDIPTRAVYPLDQAVVLLTDPDGLVQAQKILQNPLYYRSNPIMRRTVIDLPIFQQFTKRARRKTSFSFSPFFTQTYNEYFYGTNKHIQSYLDMNQDALDTQVDLISQLDDVEFIPEGFSVSRILDLFKTIYLEERKTGLMFEFVKDTPLWTLSGRVPFMYAEHNLNMKQEDREKVQSNPFFASENNSEMEFAKDHLISDLIGFGDTRINYEYLFIQNHAQVFSIGGRMTIPTAFALKRGLYGSYFSPNTPDPTFDLYTDLLQPALSSPPDQNIPLAQQNVIDFGYQVMDRLSAMVLQAPLGNNHHVGVGIFTHNKMIFSPRWYLEGITSAEVTLPALEHRFFILNTNPGAFSAFDWADTEAATGQLPQKLAFLNEQFIRKFFPTMYDVIVFPGFIFQSTSALFYKGNRTLIGLGTDFYWRTKESFIEIYAPEHVKQTLIDKKTAKTRYALQSSFWGMIERRPTIDSSWKLGLKGEVTSNSFGIGEDWAASILIQREF